MPEPLMREWVSRKRAADYFGVSQATITNWIKKGKLDGIKIGKSQTCSVRVSAASIDRLLGRARQHFEKSER